MLGLKLTPENVASNRKKIDAEIKVLEAQVMGLRALHAANQAMCDHKGKQDVYDPGYAGGGHDGYRCPTCGKRGYF